MSIQIPGFATDQQYPFWYLRKMMAAFGTAGVVNPSTDYIVSPSSGLQVQVTSGTAFVQQTVNIEGSSAYNGLYLCINDATANPVNTITAPVSNPRIDQVILRVYDVQEQGLGGSSKGQIEWLPGTESASASLATMGPGLSNPGAATLPANSLRLAYVLQTVGESSVSGSNVLNVVGQAQQSLAQTSSVVTSLPSIPYDGQEIRFLADSTNGVVWHFRYRAASSSTFKWEFIGGPPLYASTDASDVLSSSGSYQNLSGTSGPAITLPTLPNGGDFDVEVLAWAEVNNSGQSGATFMSYAVGGTGALDADAAVFQSASTGFFGANAASKRRKAAIASATTITAKYKGTGTLTAGACQWANRVMAITPVRVG